MLRWTVLLGACAAAMALASHPSYHEDYENSDHHMHHFGESDTFRNNHGHGHDDRDSEKQPWYDRYFNGDHDDRGDDDKWDDDMTYDKHMSDSHRGQHHGHDHQGRDNGDDRGNHIDDRPHKGNDDDGGHHKDEQTLKPPHSAPFAQPFRQDTEAFVSDVVTWVNDVVGVETAATLVIDTTFSLSKSGQVEKTHDDQSCGDVSVLRQLFPVVRKFVEHPQDVDLSEVDIKAIEWTPNSACTNPPEDPAVTMEISGGMYAGFQITCGNQVLLNVSIATSGSTPTVQAKPVEDHGLYIDVDLMDGALTAVDAQGSIIGVLRSRHFPENAEEVVKNWTEKVQQCGADKTLVVTGVVGGGWTEYKPDESNQGSFVAAAVGYSETFELSFPSPLGQPMNEGPPEAHVPGVLRTNIRHGPPTIDKRTKHAASDSSAMYIQSGLACVMQPTRPSGCSGSILMAQLASFHNRANIVASVWVPSTLSASQDPTDTITTPVFLIGAFVAAFAAVVAVSIVTVRRRNGYELVNQTI